MIKCVFIIFQKTLALLGRFRCKKSRVFYIRRRRKARRTQKRFQGTSVLPLKFCHWFLVVFNLVFIYVIPLALEVGVSYLT